MMPGERSGVASLACDRGRSQGSAEVSPAASAGSRRLRTRRSRVRIYGLGRARPRSPGRPGWHSRARRHLCEAVSDLTAVRPSRTSRRRSPRRAAGAPPQPREPRSEQGEDRGVKDEIGCRARAHADGDREESDERADERKALRPQAGCPAPPRREGGGDERRAEHEADHRLRCRRLHMLVPVEKRTPEWTSAAARNAPASSARKDRTRRTIANLDPGSQRGMGSHIVEGLQTSKHFYKIGLMRKPPARTVRT